MGVTSCRSKEASMISNCTVRRTKYSDGGTLHNTCWNQNAGMQECMSPGLQNASGLYRGRDTPSPMLLPRRYEHGKVGSAWENNRPPHTHIVRRETRRQRHQVLCVVYILRGQLLFATRCRVDIRRIDAGQRALGESLRLMFHRKTFIDPK